MMTDIFPGGVQSAGMNTFYLLTVPPADRTAPTAAELNAATTIDITCYVPADSFQVSLEQGTEDDTRWCDETAREEFAPPSLRLDRLSHIVDPQGTGEVAEVGNLLKMHLQANSDYYLAWRLGVPRATAAAAEQVVVGFDLGTGAAFTPPRHSGKYRRDVMVSLTAATDLDGVAITAGTVGP